MSGSFAELGALPTAELQDRAFARARERADVAFFWSLFEHLPAAEGGNDGGLGVQSTVDDAAAVWRESTNHEYGDEEPLIRAAFIDYLLKH
ncbi:hypothetical protein GCM10023322_67060 [Rugosimonospora acidiphila]|uniref:Uncharacterized protein n=1 Tax=Rugosimonospora acidiphila TaxID=556531 RepID=A0ABP9SIE7_9ACTN